MINKGFNAGNAYFHNDTTVAPLSYMDLDLASTTPALSDIEDHPDEFVSLSDDEKLVELIQNTVTLSGKTMKNDEKRNVSSSSSSNNSNNSDTLSTSGYYDAWCSKYMSFTDDNATTYHAISTLSASLEAAGFEYKAEKEPFDILASGGAYFVTRGGKALCAFLVGAKWSPEKGIGAVGSHVDALTAKLKPVSIKTDVKGYSLLGVAPYSGALNLLWLDRDLGIAGSVLVRESDGKVSSKLISSGRHAICRIPSLAPHFGASSLPPYNKETQMAPVIAYG